MRRRLIVLCLVALAAKSEAVTFDFTSNKIYLPVKVNNKGPYSFILDTGAIWNVIDVECAKALKISTGGESQVTGAGEGSLPGSVGKNVDLNVDGAATGKQDVEVLPINSAISFSEGRKVDGLLGAPFFERFVVEIDYINRRVQFHEPAKFQYADPAEPIPLEIERGNVFISANLVLPNGKRVAGKFLVDTGWRVALSLTAPVVREHKLVVMTNTIVATTGVGIGGPVTHPIGRISALEIGRHVIKNPVTDFSNATGGILAQGDFTGIIGAEVLRRFNVVIDYPQKRLLLQPNANFDQPYDFDMAGLYVAAEGKDFKTFKVYKIIPNSPAGVAGIHEGDQIWAINNQPVAKFTLEQIRQMFRQPEKEYSLGLLRGDNMVQTKLTTRRLI